MTTPRVPRVTARVPRALPARPAPSHTARHARGPRAPLEVVAALQRAVRVELGLHQDSAREPHLVFFGQRWQVSAQRAATVLISAAKRGVAQALAAAIKKGGDIAAPADAAVWIAHLTRVVEAAARKSATAAEEQVAIEVLRQHAEWVRYYAEKSGSTGYIWTTSHGTRVRQLHRELEGTRHAWDDPPVSGTDGFRGPPGTPAKCECCAYPVL